MNPRTAPTISPPRLAIMALGGLLWLSGCATVPRPGIVPEAATVDAGASSATPTESMPSKPRVAPIDPTAEIAEQPPARLTDGGTLFQRMADGFAPPVCVRGEHKDYWRQRYASHPRPLEAQLRGAMPLMAWVVEQVETRNLPMEFALIPLIESGYRPEARGTGGPIGLWQMIGSTARHYGVLIGYGYDGRLSPIDSTHAALDHLETLHAEFGNWRAAAMAYNAGRGRLHRAFAEAGDRRVSEERRLPPGLSGITYAYIAKLHALACLITEPGHHGLTLPSEPFVPLEQSIVPAHLHSLDAVASAWSLDPITLRALNPSYQSGLPNKKRAPRALLHPRRESVDTATSSPHSSVQLARRDTLVTLSPSRH